MSSDRGQDVGGQRGKLFRGVPRQGTAPRKRRAGVVEVLGRRGQGVKREAGGRAGAGRPCGDSIWLSRGAHVPPQCPPPSARGPSKGACASISGGGHVSEDLCHFLEAERGFPAEVGEEQEHFGQGCWEAGGGNTRPEALVPGSGQGGLKGGSGAQSRGAQGARRA